MEAPGAFRHEKDADAEDDWPDDTDPNDCAPRGCAVHVPGGDGDAVCCVKKVRCAVETTPLGGTHMRRGCRM